MAEKIVTNRYIVVLNGSGGSGKNTFAEICNDHIPIKHISSVDQIKQYARLMGWNEDKNIKSRKFLSDLKNLHIQYNNGPSQYVLTQINNFVKESDKAGIIFVDIREPYEIEKIISVCRYKIYTALVTNDNVKQITSNDADKNVADYKYDFVIDNSGSLSDLKDETKLFLSALLFKID